jgi:hypothetical protein
MKRQFKEGSDEVEPGSGTIREEQKKPVTVV